MMKSIKIYLLMFCSLLAGMLVSCQSELDYQKGEPDLESCYGVYFPTQAAQKDHEFEPSEDGYKVEFKVKRLKPVGRIVVPYILESEEGMIGSELVFEDGQSETILTVSLPEDTEMGLVYKCNIVIEDPLYALKYYNDYKTSIDCSAVVLQWNRIKGSAGEEYGLWRDDFITCVMNYPTYDNTEVIVEERADKPGYFRLRNVYNPEYVRRLLEPQGMGDDIRIYEPLCNSEKNIFIDATNPEKVFIPAQRTGLDLTPVGATEVIILSLNSDNVPIEPSESIYGTYDKDKGLITFPENSILMSFLGDVFYVNTRSLFRVMLPGFKPVDYNVVYDADFTKNGEVNIDYTFGKDVRKAKYAVYEGRLNSAVVSQMAQTIRKSDDAVELTDAEGSIKVSGKSVSGVYTLVSANFADPSSDITEDDNYAGYSYLHFTYEAVGDEVDVELTAELVATNRNLEDGHTAENALESFIVGKDIEEAYVIIRSGDLTGIDEQTLIDTYFTPEIEAFMLNPVSEDVLNQINGKGYSAVTGGLAKGAEYTILVYANNGYKWQVIKSLGRTAGIYDIKTDTFSYGEHNTEIYPAPLTDFAGVYDYYAVNRLKEGATEREYVGKVSIVLITPTTASISGLLGPDGLEALVAVGKTNDNMSLLHTGESVGAPGYLNTYSYPFTYVESSSAGNVEEFYYYVMDGVIKMPVSAGYIGKYRLSGYNTIVLSATGAGNACLLGGVVEGADGSVAVAFADTEKFYFNPGITFSGIACAAFDSYFSATTKVFSAYDKPLLIPADDATRENLKKHLPKK